VREGRETYGRELVHWYVKWPVRRHFWHTVDEVAFGLLVERPCGANLDILLLSAEGRARGEYEEKA
jgi:hypothetical protein